MVGCMCMSWLVEVEERVFVVKENKNKKTCAIIITYCTRYYLRMMVKATKANSSLDDKTKLTTLILIVGKIISSTQTELEAAHKPTGDGGQVQRPAPLYSTYYDKVMKVERILVGIGICIEPRDVSSCWVASKAESALNSIFTTIGMSNVRDMLSCTTPAAPVPGQRPEADQCCAGEG